MRTAPDCISPITAALANPSSRNNDSTAATACGAQVTSNPPLVCGSHRSACTLAAGAPVRSADERRIARHLCAAGGRRGAVIVSRRGIRQRRGDRRDAVRRGAHYRGLSVRSAAYRLWKREYEIGLCVLRRKEWRIAERGTACQVREEVCKRYSLVWLECQWPSL